MAKVLKFDDISGQEYTYHGRAYKRDFPDAYPIDPSKEHHETLSVGPLKEAVESGEVTNEYVFETLDLIASIAAGGNK